MKRNNPIPHNHFKKTSLRYKHWFNQAARHERRRKTRIAKAKKIYPLPTQKLRPIVRCPTIRYNKKERLGRGFTPEECKAAGLDYKYARTIGISVDLRRKNNNEESFNKNVDRLKEYLGKIVIYKSKAEARDSAAIQHLGTIMPIAKVAPTIKIISKDELDNNTCC